jgi:hypothetical protein
MPIFAQTLGLIKEYLKPYLIISLLLVITGRSSFCQGELLEKFETRRQYCSQHLFLYSDSTYALERGCEGYRQVSVGEFSRNGNDIKLMPYKQLELDIIQEIQFDTITGSSDSLDIQFILSKGEVRRLGYTVTTLAHAESWSRDSISDIYDYNVLDFNPDGKAKINWKKTQDSLAVCLRSLENTIGKKIFIPVNSNVTRVKIYLNLPVELVDVTYSYNETYTTISGTLAYFTGINVWVEN